MIYPSAALFSGTKKALAVRMALRKEVSSFGFYSCWYGRELQEIQNEGANPQWQTRYLKKWVEPTGKRETIFSQI
jgi:hypothetical protein